MSFQKVDSIRRLFENPSVCFDILQNPEITPLKTWNIDCKKVELFYRNRQKFSATITEANKKKIFIREPEIIGISKIKNSKNIEEIAKFFSSTQVKLLPPYSNGNHLWVLHIFELNPEKIPVTEDVQLPIEEKRTRYLEMWKNQAQEWEKEAQQYLDRSEQDEKYKKVLRKQIQHQICIFHSFGSLIYDKLKEIDFNNNNVEKHIEVLIQLMEVIKQIFNGQHVQVVKSLNEHRLLLEKQLGIQKKDFENLFQQITISQEDTVFIEDLEVFSKTPLEERSYALKFLIRKCLLKHNYTVIEYLREWVGKESVNFNMMLVFLELKEFSNARQIAHSLSLPCEQIQKPFLKMQHIENKVRTIVCLDQQILCEERPFYCEEKMFEKITDRKQNLCLLLPDFSHLLTPILQIRIEEPKDSISINVFLNGAKCKVNCIYLFNSYFLTLKLYNQFNEKQNQNLIKIECFIRIFSALRYDYHLIKATVSLQSKE